MALTGRADGPPLGPPAPLVPELLALADRLAASTARGGRPVRIDPLALLGERAALAGLTRRGTTSCGGATRLLPTSDGWIAISLARTEDWAAVPAWLGVAGTGTGDETWDAIASTVADRPTELLLAEGVLLALPIAALPVAALAGDDDRGAHCGSSAVAGLPVLARCVDDRAAPRALADAVVLDLTSLWAGPLCGAVLADAGGRVVKVESTGRPDGARRGPGPFFDLLNAGKESVAVDLGTAIGRGQLAALVRRADVVLEAARPRGLEQLGISARRDHGCRRPAGLAVDHRPRPHGIRPRAGRLRRRRRGGRGTRGPR